MTQETAAPVAAPSTADVLRLIGKDGVVVGSFAEVGASNKDVDVVVKENDNPEEPYQFSVLQRVLAQYRPFCESEAVGHLWVNALPLPVELFATRAWRTGDPVKDAKRITYRQARRKSRLGTVFGVEMRVLVDTKV